MKKTTDYSNIIRYTSLFGGVQGLNILVGIVRNKLVAMLLGPDGMGLISLFNSTMKFVSESTNMGISISAVRKISEHFDRNDTEALEREINLVRSWSCCTGLLGMLVALVFSPLLSRFTFSWNGHTLHFALLSPIVAMMAITGGELAILKGIRRLNKLALISVLNVVGALLTSIPLYYLFLEQAIVPSLVLMAAIQMGVTIAYSYRLHPLRISFRWANLQQGAAMLRLGIAFVLAGILGSGADFFIRSYLSNAASIEMVGLYNAGYMMTMTYVGVVFTAMETDFFPRLSGVNGYAFTFSQTVNRQIEVMLLLVSPLLAVFSLLLPTLLPLLYTGKFLPALDMMQVVMLAMYFRALKLPVQYIPLAKGDSLSYLFLEAIYDILLIVLVIVFFNLYGLVGAGWGITLAGFIDFVVVFIYARWRYDYRPSKTIFAYAIILIPIGLLIYFVTSSPDPRIYWGAGVLLALCSTATSVFILRKKTNLWNKLIDKICRR
ncbi:MAG: oligosaccharide flippase family protein [Prevotella sp.]|nr:oligosaccharide flippase family protein [Prevotella sp.]MDD7273139.1 oligosaccharide flippase family protein [Prevotellaceae bacterium]MDY3936003.1 oligosaccharide flippase family protein [Prevotella sp.]MDY4218554.1 oligosaccharide flippase family protein [Prevotella sp.]